MRGIKLFTLLCLCATILSAQNGINYKALVKEANGNVLSSSVVSIQFIIYEGDALTNNVYQESHTLNTDANGFVMVNIGEGTSGDDFNAIKWSVDEHFLNVQINAGSGLVDLGTTQFMAVPYALHATNVSGLEAIDEANGIGWRLIGSNPDNYGNIGENAVDLSYSNIPTGIYGARGIESIAMGRQTVAFGDHSTAMGYTTSASGDASIAMGYNTTAFGNYATAMGIRTGAIGNASTAMGYYTTAYSYASTAIGRYNIGGGNPITWIDTDPVFEIGNGEGSSNISNALTVLKNGTITAPSFDLDEITDDKALITKEYADTNLTVSGLEAINEGNGVGWRLKGQNPDNYGNIGFNAIDLSIREISSTTSGATGTNSTAMGQRTIASGISATSMGYATTASGNNSTAMGFGTIASNNSSIAMGSNTRALDFYSTATGNSTIASGLASIAMGNNTTASGYFSTTMGNSTIAKSYASVAIGRFNIGSGSANDWLSSDPLFEVGNGANDNNRSNALTVLKNGDTGIDTDTPQARLHITGGNDTGLGNNHGYLLLGQAGGSNISIDNNEIMARNNGNIADLSLQIEGGNVKIGGPLYIGDETIKDAGNDALLINAALIPEFDDTNVIGNSSQRWRTVYAVNGTINTSDRREKKNINTLNYGLAEVLQMQPVSFNWKNTNNPDVKLGLIAQDLQTIIPEVVKSHTWETDETGQLTKKELERLGVYYSDLVPVLIKAIQEQNKIIEHQSEDLKASNENYKALLSRVEHLESKPHAKKQTVITSNAKQSQ